MRGFGGLESVIMHMVGDQDGTVTARELSTNCARTGRSPAPGDEHDGQPAPGGLAGPGQGGKACRVHGDGYTATASREECSARLMREALAGGGDTEAVLSHSLARQRPSR